ncbi:hypothetical protein IGI04_037191, partial [Brassica rapa subsp. trilocularis]
RKKRENVERREIYFGGSALGRRVSVRAGAGASRLVRALVPTSSLTVVVVLVLEQQRSRQEAPGGGSGMHVQWWCFPGGGGFRRSTAAGSSFREGSLLQIRLRRLLVMESGGYHSSALPLWIPRFFGKRFLGLSGVTADEILVEDKALRRDDDSQGKKEMVSWVACLGFEVCQSRRRSRDSIDLSDGMTRRSDEQGSRGCLLRWRQGGGDQVEAVTTCDALMEQITPRVEPPP